MAFASSNGLADVEVWSELTGLMFARLYGAAPTFVSSCGMPREPEVLGG